LAPSDIAAAHPTDDTTDASDGLTPDEYRKIILWPAAPKLSEAKKSGIQGIQLRHANVRPMRL
jgi:hypothetical protein